MNVLGFWWTTTFELKAAQLKLFLMMKNVLKINQYVFGNDDIFFRRNMSQRTLSP